MLNSNHKKASEYRVWKSLKNKYFRGNALMNNSWGFSLMELIIVIAIMGVLVGLLVPNFTKMAEEKRKQACRENRTAVLNIYARCVYDSSVKDVQNDTASLLKVMPTSSDRSTNYGVSFKPVASEIGQYIVVPNSSEHNMYDSAVMTVGVDTATGTAWIECATCEDKVSLDMTGWNASPAPKSTDAPVATPDAATPTPVPSPGICYVTFNTNGRGTFDDVNPQEVESGKTAKMPKAPTHPTYDFKGWYKESGCTNAFNFSTIITEDITLYAKWEGRGSSAVWPYASDKDWWELAENGTYAHAGEVADYKLSKPGDTIDSVFVSLNTPSGIFTSKAGNQFVLVEASGNSCKIEYKNAESPELFSAMYPNYLVQLTGTEYVIEITDITSGEVYIPVRTNGDLIKIKDGDRIIEYVYWHSELADARVNVEKLRENDSHPGNMYRVTK